MPRQKTSTSKRTAPAKTSRISAAPKRRPRAEKIEIPTTPSPVVANEAEVLRSLAGVSASEFYQREKLRRAGLQRSENDPIAEARREFQAMLAAEAGTPRGGRPRKVKPKKDELALEDSLDDFHGGDAAEE